MNTVEMVVLLDDAGRHIGEARKSEVHTTDTPLHLAVSCYLMNHAGEVLLTRRSPEKKAWPGIWTNSFCGHPGPGEEQEEAVMRRARFELGTDVTRIELALPDFRYRAVDPFGIVENEICPVYTALVHGELKPNPTEVADWVWVTPDLLSGALEHSASAFSPWLAMQFPQLIKSGALQAGARA